jgi:hypothetical protein
VGNRTAYMFTNVEVRPVCIPSAED